MTIFKKHKNRFEEISYGGSMWSWFLFPLSSRSGAHENKIETNHTSPISYLLCRRKNTVGDSFWRVYSFFTSAHLPTYIYTFHLVFYLLSTVRRFLSFFLHIFFLFSILTIDFCLITPYTPVRNSYRFSSLSPFDFLIMLPYQ
jgi:hypothetical protein